MITPEQQQKINAYKAQNGIPSKTSVPTNASAIDRVLNNARAKRQTPITIPENKAVNLRDVDPIGGTGKTPTLAEFLISPVQENEGLGSKITRGVLGNVKNFGESIAGAIIPHTSAQENLNKARQMQTDSQTQLINLIKEKRAKGEDTSRLIQALRDSGYSLPSDSDLNPAINKSAKQVAGEALGVATDIISAGSGPGVAKNIVTKPATILGGIASGALKGAASGALSGGVQGVARGMQEDKSLGGIATEGTVGAVTGGALGGIVGGVSGGIAGGLRSRATPRAEAAEAFKSGDITDASTAKYMTPKIEAVNQAQIKLKTDPKATQAIKQGIPERDIALIKAAGPDDQKVFRQMASLAEKAGKDRTITERPMDIAGETALKPARHIQSTILQQGKELDKVAEKLVGQPVEALDDVVTKVDEDLARYGVSIDDSFTEAGPVALKNTGSKLNFTGSDFEGTGSNEKIIDNVYRRLTNANDAHDLHRLKKYIDNNVEFGKSGEGLTGASERVLKDWRKLIDTTLDTEFPDYNSVNSILSENIQALDELSSIMGRKFKLADPLAGIKAGQVSSRLLSNSPNRGEILNAINTINEIARKSGFKSGEDVIYQVNFADILEDIFGTQATRSLKGEVGRATESTLQTLSRGETGIGELAIKGVASGIEKLRDISPESKIRALKALINLGK